MAKACVFEQCFPAIKSFCLLFCSPSADCKQRKRSNIWKGNEGLEQPRAGLIWRCAGRAFTWTSVITLAPMWIISTIITSFKTRLSAALSHDAIKDNRCCRCLEGTEIKDYFTIWSLLQAKTISPTLSLCRAWRGGRVGAHFPPAWQFWEWSVWQRVNIV